MRFVQYLNLEATEVFFRLEILGFLVLGLSFIYLFFCWVEIPVTTSTFVMRSSKVKALGLVGGGGGGGVSG